MSRIKRRDCERFEIPGAGVVYKLEKVFFKGADFTQDIFPVYDISYGGVRFLSQTNLKNNVKIALQIYLPDNDEPLFYRGTVVWVSHHPGQDYSSQIGVQFFPYGEKKGLNSPENLSRLKELEKKHGSMDMDIQKPTNP